ncbi:MAG: hypothetical protein K8S23_02425 [Candidatus Cloacimonetes bacterium]|nr:hypothetical protein [Candidatus Cloacimonadota bacterium]
MYYKTIFIIITVLFFLSGCDNDPKLITNIETCSIDGNIYLENASTDTIEVRILINQTVNEEIYWETEADDSGHFQISNLPPGNYSISYFVDSRHYTGFVGSVTLFKDDHTTLNPITRARIENDCGITGFIVFEDKELPIASIDIFYKEAEEYFFDKTIQSDTSGFYQTNELFPGEHKIVFTIDDYPEVMKFPTLQPGELVVLDTITFEQIILIEQVNIDIDGNLDDWNEPVYINDHSSGWGESNNFNDFYLGYDSDILYVAISGGFSNSENTINIYFDIDSDTTGINDFSMIQGGDIGNHLRKEFTCPDFFGADIAFSGWALQHNMNVVSLENPEAVDNAILEANIIMNTDTIEFAIPLTEMYENGIIPDHREISLVAIIGGGDDVSIADDSIPQQNNVLVFETVLSAKFAQ